jgi:ABC-type transport system involved in cytochrome c biogenesis permease subunit
VLSNSPEDEARFDHWGTGCALWLLSIVVSVGVIGVVLHQAKRHSPTFTLLSCIAFGIFFAVAFFYGLSRVTEGALLHIVFIGFLVVGTPIAIILMFLVACNSQPW